MNDFSTMQLQLATPVERPPTGDGWLHEVKYDGYRMAAVVQGGRVRLLTRNGLNWTARFGEAATALAALPVKSAVLDGEMVALDRQGRAGFSRLQASLAGEGNAAITYQLFDLLQLDGRDLRDRPLEERQSLLAGLLQQAEPGPLRFTEQLAFPGDQVFAQACRLDLEGIVSKRLGSGYRAGRGPDWLKCVCLKSADFVVLGYTKPQGSRSHFGALLLGEYVDGHDAPVYVGKVGTGFGSQDLEHIHELLAGNTKAEPAVAGEVPASVRRSAIWVEPDLVVEVAYSQRTAGGLLRQARFKRVRPDKPAAQAQRSGNEADMADDTITVAGVRLTNPARILYPEQGLSKQDLAEYYQAVGSELVRWIAGRPLSLVRCPEGTGGSCFYQKHPGAAFAERLKRVTIQEEDGPDEYLVVQEPEDLVALVQAGVLEIHTWGSKVEHLEYPDQLVFDLDPDERVGFPKLKDYARELRKLLADVGLTAFLRVTGGKGLHLVTPIEPDTGWAEAKEFSRTIAETFAGRHPQELTTNMSKAKRKGRVFIDYLRNGRGSTAICNWSTRSRPGAPVAVPIRWDELSRVNSAAAWTPAAAMRRLGRLESDPWSGFEGARRSLAELVKA